MSWQVPSDYKTRDMSWQVTSDYKTRVMSWQVPSDYKKDEIPRIHLRVQCPWRSSKKDHSHRRIPTRWSQLTLSFWMRVKEIRKMHYYNDSKKTMSSLHNYPTSVKPISMILLQKEHKKLRTSRFTGMFLLGSEPQTCKKTKFYFFLSAWRFIDAISL